MNKVVPMHGFGGGGALLNFEVVGGTTEPSDPKENTIWVNTDQKITSWEFSATEPQNPIVGMVWIRTTATSNISFNALKKNGIRVYPNQAYQWDGSEWVFKTLKIIQNGSSIDTLTYLYHQGDLCEVITGGYTSLTFGTGSKSCNINQNSISVYANGDPSHTAMAGASTRNKIDLKDVRKITVTGNCSEYSKDAWIGIRVHSSKELGDTKYVAQAYATTTGSFSLDLDVSGLSDSYYVIVCALGYYNGYAGGTFSEITMHY